MGHPNKVYNFFIFQRAAPLCVCWVASVVSYSLWPYGLKLARFLCPWNSPDKNIGVGYHTLFLGIFLTHRSNPSLLCVLQWQKDSLPLAPPGNSLRALESESHSVVSDSLWPHGLQNARLPCPSPTPGACSNSCPLNQIHFTSQSL